MNFLSSSESRCKLNHGANDQCSGKRDQRVNVFGHAADSENVDRQQQRSNQLPGKGESNGKYFEHGGDGGSKAPELRRFVDDGERWTS
jgi:hypothetical protein